jgi:hypothetical protein
VFCVRLLVVVVVGCLLVVACSCLTSCASSSSWSLGGWVVVVVVVVVVVRCLYNALVATYYVASYTEYHHARRAERWHYTISASCRMIM